MNLLRKVSLRLSNSPKTRFFSTLLWLLRSLTPSLHMLLWHILAPYSKIKKSQRLKGSRLIEYACQSLAFRCLSQYRTVSISMTAKRVKQERQMQSIHSRRMRVLFSAYLFVWRIIPLSNRTSSLWYTLSIDKILEAARVNLASSQASHQRIYWRTRRHSRRYRTQSSWCRSLMCGLMLRYRLPKTDYWRLQTTQDSRCIEIIEYLF